MTINEIFENTFLQNSEFFSKAETMTPTCIQVRILHLTAYSYSAGQKLINILMTIALRTNHEIAKSTKQHTPYLSKVNSEANIVGNDAV
jgi:hypothetical protein